MGSTLMNLISMCLISLTPTGLFLDIVGFILVYKYRDGFAPIISNRDLLNNEGKDGDYGITLPDRSDEEIRIIQEEDRRKRRRVLTGLGLILFGFALQIIGSIASILL